MEKPGLVEESGRLSLSRRYFLRNVTFGVAGAALGSAVTSGSSTALPFSRSSSRVSFLTGTDRREMVYQALKPFEKEIKKGIRDKQVIIKTNFVYNGSPLCATHPDAVRGLLDFLQPMYKKRIIVAFPPGRHNISLQNMAHASFIIGRKKLLDSQLPEEVTKPDGFSLRRPAEWA